MDGRTGPNPVTCVKRVGKKNVGACGGIPSEEIWSVSDEPTKSDLRNVIRELMALAETVLLREPRD
jgi:hypothetical protein